MRLYGMNFVSIALMFAQKSLTHKIPLCQESPKSNKCHLANSLVLRVLLGLWILIVQVNLLSLTKNSYGQTCNQAT